MEAPRNDLLPLSEWDSSATWNIWLATCRSTMKGLTIEPSPKISDVTKRLQSVLQNIRGTATAIIA